MCNENDTTLLQMAAAWHARLAAPDCSAQERAQFEQWLSRDQRHVEAFASVQRTANTVTRAAQDDPRLQALADAAFAQGQTDRHASRQRPRSKVPLALAATVLFCVVALRFIPEFESVRAPTVAYATAPGETRTITLSDGSIVKLDVASSIKARLQAGERSIELTSGRAYFQVAHDASRPFAVTVQNVRTVALGTQFQVQEEHGQITVTLLQGSIRVSDVASDRPEWQHTLVPGEQLRVAAGSAPQRRSVSTQGALGWLRGRHVFEATPLAEAVDEINRYSTRKLRLGDPSLAELRIGGNFIAGDSAAIAAAISAALPVEVVQGGDQEIILFRRH